MIWLFNTLILGLYFVLYGLIHSWLASLTVKQKVEEWFGPQARRGYRLFYNLFAIMTLLPFFALQAMLPNPKLYSVPSPWRWVMVAGQLVGLVGAVISLWQTGLFHFLGLSQLTTDSPTENRPLTIKGFYKWVRHPIYFFSLLFIWLTPIMYLNQLIAYILFSLYFYLGSIYEERKLVAEFGDTYRDYQQRVPRLLPLMPR